MKDYILRLWQPEDKPELKALWELAFGDDGEYIDTFFRSFLKEDSCVVAECDDKVVSAMYILGNNTLWPYRKNRLTAGYTYALATLPEYRGRGIGKAVYQAAAEKALEKHDIAAVLPAEEGLYPFYESANGAKALSIRREAIIKAEDLKDVKVINAARIPAFHYFGIRESILRGMPHVTFSEEMIDFMEDYMEEHGDFFMTEEGIAMVEPGDGTCRITELLCPDTDGMSVIAAVAAYHRTEEYLVRSPFFFSGPGKKKTSVLGVLKEEPEYPMPFDMWWGFGLD